MAESLFDIFGDHLTKKAVKNVTRQPFSNIENKGKTVQTAPIKPNEPVKKVEEIKKSFLSNTGKALQSTPMRKAFTPKSINLGSLIYNDDNNTNDIGYNIEDLHFTKPVYKNDNYHRDLLDFLPMPELQMIKEVSPPNTPPPSIKRHSMEFDCSYQDEFFTETWGLAGQLALGLADKNDDFSIESIPDDDLGLPELY